MIETRWVKKVCLRRKEWSSQVDFLREFPPTKLPPGSQQLFVHYNYCSCYYLSQSFIFMIIIVMVDMTMIIIVITGRRDARLVGEEVWTVSRSSIRGDWHDYICSLFCCFCSFWSTWLYLQSFCLFCCFWQLLKRWSTINQVDTEQDRVILIRTVVQFMATKVGPQFMVFFLATFKDSLTKAWCRHT